MPVSGTKTALIERLRPFKDPTSSPSHSGSNDITTVTFPVTPTGSLSSYQSPSSSSALSQGGYYPYPSTSSTPPISPASSDLSRSGSLPDSFSDVPMSSPPQFGLQPSPAQLSSEEGLGGGGLSGAGLRGGEGMEGLEAEKDKMLVEKQKVIEELTWKLHQEQRQVGNRTVQFKKMLLSLKGHSRLSLPTVSTLFHNRWRSSRCSCTRGSVAMVPHMRVSRLRPSPTTCTSSNPPR